MISEYRKFALSILVGLACCVVGRVPVPGVQSLNVQKPVAPSDLTPKPRKPLLPWREQAVEANTDQKSYGASVGGNVSPDGAEIHADLPGDLHRRNTSSKGLGLCVFTSIHHSALWQNIPALQEMPKWLIDKGIPGGGYPEKVKDLIPKICKDRGLPEPDYIQIENADHEVLSKACKTGRMVCATYSRSPTGRYGGGRISHMVSVPHADEKFVAVLDNNYIQSYEWMTPDEAKRAGVYEWLIVFLSPPPPPPPKN